MKVFISWSGDSSRQVAVILRDWLQLVIQTLDPYVSSEDIEKGARWGTDVARELEASAFGILCITPDNPQSPWINFEAGALAKALDKGRVTPLLLGLKPSDMTGPLVQFQATVVSQEDMFKLILSLNKVLVQPLDEGRLRRSFDRWWPDLEKSLKGVDVSTSQVTRKSPAVEPSMMEELLDLARSQQRTIIEIQERLGPTSSERLSATSAEEPSTQLEEYSPPEEPQSAVTLPNLTGVNILLIADGELATTLIGILRLCRAFVSVARSASKAFAAMDQRAFTIVLVTDTFPGPKNLVALLRNARRKRAAPFIAIVSEPRAWTVKGKGFAAVFNKPVEIDRLLDTITHLTSGGGATRLDR